MRLKNRIRIIERTDAESQALVYAQQVATGAKLIATIMVRKDLTDAVSETAAREQCYTTAYAVNEDWTEVVLYKYPFARCLWEELDARQSGQGLPGVLDVWTVGKLFGYSDYEIANYLQTKGYVDSALT